MKGYQSRLPTLLANIDAERLTLLGGTPEERASVGPQHALYKNGVQVGHEVFERVKVLTNAMRAAPHILIDDKLIHAVIPTMKTLGGSLEKLVEAGGVKLPYPMCVLEMSNLANFQERVFYLLHEDVDKPMHFNIIRFSLTPKAPTFAVITPVVLDAVFQRSTQDANWAQSSMCYAPLSASLDYMSKFESLKSVLSHAMFDMVIFGCMLWRTKGVEKDTVEAEPALNRARRRMKRPELAPYTLLRVGHVYDRKGGEHSVREGFVMPVHWRIGHWRNQAHGPGWKEHRRVWIEAMLVNYEGDLAGAPKPQHLATV